MLSLAQAVQICENAVAACLTKGFAPITIVVMDPAGHPIAMQRMDDCAPAAFPKFAHAKAFTCVSLGVSTRAFRDKYTIAKDPTKYCQMLGMIDVTGGQMAPFPGGIVIREREGKVVGAVGVSGASADEDEYCALAGVEAANLEGMFTEPVCHSLKEK